MRKIPAKDDENLRQAEEDERTVLTLRAKRLKEENDSGAATESSPKSAVAAFPKTAPKTASGKTVLQDDAKTRAAMQKALYGM
jgi:hypothetical protein|mmetsp:Transcript_13439/g.35255  ORF Transcript_13439/g.35255 Transcript_13439/m.35255 type:complete len:83 (-) Transcript_13439:79-327(-)